MRGIPVLFIYAQKHDFHSHSMTVYILIRRTLDRKKTTTIEHSNIKIDRKILLHNVKICLFTRT